MLLSKEVKVKWNSKNKEWYESRGYKFTKWKDEFTVEIEDLSDSSKSLVNIKCDCETCKNPYLNPMKWANYLRYIKEDNKYYCNSCSKKLFSTKRVGRVKVKSISFEQWCIENNRQDVLDRWDYELNNCSPSEISFRSRGLDRRGYWFKCDKNYKHCSELKSIAGFVVGQNGSIECNQCNSFAQCLIDTYGENVLDLYWDYGKNNELGINPWEIDKSSGKKIWIKCQEKEYHESYLIGCSSFTSMNVRCPYCGYRKTHILDSLGKFLEDKELMTLWSDKNKKSPYYYAPNSGQKVWWKCPDGKHSDYKRKINDTIRYQFRCASCTQERNESFLQEKVRLHLESLNYPISHEHTCSIIATNPKTKHKLPFDNEVKFKNNKYLIIEVMGEQHYKINNFHKLQAKKYNTTPKHQLHMQKLRDRYKRIYAKSQGYEYLEIPYWTDDENETWKQLIDNKIKEILNKIKE